MGYIIKRISLDDGKTWCEPMNMEKEFNTSITTDNIRGGNFDCSDYMKYNSNTPNLDRIAREISINIK